MEVYEEGIIINARFDKLCDKLSAQGITIIRYSFKKNRKEFIMNEDLWCLITHAGIELLPATYVNGHIMKTESYPSEKEIKDWIRNPLINN